MSHSQSLSWRIFIALSSGAVVVGLCLFLVASHGYPGEIQSPQYFTAFIFKKLDNGIKLFRSHKGRLPTSLHEVFPENSLGSPGNLIIKDGWHRAIKYIVRGEKYSLLSYGADGVPGGHGLNCDLSQTNPKPPDATPTFWEHLHDPLSQGMVQASFICGALVAAITFFTTRDSDLLPESRESSISRLLATLAAATVASLIITALHFPFGH